MQTAPATITLTARERTRLERIIQRVTPADWLRYKDLTEKFENETLTDGEYEMYTALLEAIEGVEVSRLEYLAQIARQHGLSLAEFMRLSGLVTPSYV